MSERAWIDTRRAWQRCDDPEVKPRVYRAWVGHTARVAADCLPPWHPAWPAVGVLSVVSAPERNVMIDYYRIRLDARHQAWARARGLWVDDEYHFQGGYCNEGPTLWWMSDVEERDATRAWAVRRLNDTGDPDALRVTLAGACMAERRSPRYWALIEGDLTDEPNAQLRPPAYECFLIYDPTLLNRSYFDERRRPYPTGSDPVDLFWGGRP